MSSAAAYSVQHLNPDTLHRNPAYARLEHIVMWTVLVVQGHDARQGYEAFKALWGSRPNPPALTVAYVAGFSQPDYLVEIDAIAVVPQTAP